MSDKSKKGKKGTICEENVRNILQRYSLNTVLGLLQEVEQAAAEKIDWHEMAKNTATGISCAREYHMLWRYLAYGETLIDQFDDDVEPMDDDSDLEYELEAFPAISREASAEATACVKVLISSGYPNEPPATNNTTIEAPLTINIPNSKIVSAPSLLTNELQGTNICIPVSVQKQQLASGTTAEKRPNDGAPAVNLASRKRRKIWSAEEDSKLTAAVQKNGDRNWENIAKWDFKNDRSALELSQRWANLRKKQGTPKVGTSSQVQPSETLAAAHRAMSIALERGNSRTTSQITTAGIKPHNQLSQKASDSPADHQSGRAGPSKPQSLTNQPYVNRTPNPESMLKATAVAAGARIATPADASSLIEAARSQNVVHMTTGASPVMKPSATSIASQLPSNVHFIRNGLAKAPISTFSAPKPNVSQPGEAKQAQNQSIKPAPVGLSPVGTAQVLNGTTEKEKAVVSTSAKETNEPPQSNHANQADSSGCGPVERVAEDRSAGLGKQEEVEEHQPSSSGNVLKENTQDNQVSISIIDPKSQTKDDAVSLPCSEGKTKTDKQSASEKTLQNTSSDGRQEDLPSASKDGTAK